MWFKKQSGTRRRWRQVSRRYRAYQPPSSLLAVKMRRSGRWTGNWRAMTIVVSALLAVGGVLAGGWWALRIVGGKLLWENDFFTIREIRIECPGREVTRADILSFFPFRVGDNIFKLDLSTARACVLHKLPRLKDVECARRLPDALVVRARERAPIAQLKMEGYMMALDGEGCVLGVARPAAGRLPVITGHNLGGVRAGDCVAGTPIMSALDVLSACGRTEIAGAVRIVRIDVRQPDALELLLADGEQVLFSWRHMQQPSSLSREYLEQKLLKLAEIKRRGYAFNRLDMTLDNNFPAQ